MQSWINHQPIASHFRTVTRHVCSPFSSPLVSLNDKKKRKTKFRFLPNDIFEVSLQVHKIRNFFLFAFLENQTGFKSWVFLDKEVCTHSTFKTTAFKDISDYNKSNFMVRNVNFFFLKLFERKKNGYIILLCNCCRVDCVLKFSVVTRPVNYFQVFELWFSVFQYSIIFELLLNFMC